MSGFCCGVAELGLALLSCAVYLRKCLSLFAAIFLWIELASPVQRCSASCWRKGFFQSFEGRLSREASPVGPKRTLACASSARRSLRWLLSGKLGLFTFKCRLWESFEVTPACALDLAALENIPSLSFRIVSSARARGAPGALNPTPLCLRWTAGAPPSCHPVIWMTAVLILHQHLGRPLLHFGSQSVGFNVCSEGLLNHLSVSRWVESTCSDLRWIIPFNVSLYHH